MQSKFKRMSLAAILLVSALGIQPVWAEESAAPSVPAMGTMKGTISIHGKQIAYHGEAGEMMMHNAAGQPRATIFATAYLMDGADPKTRPVAFLYNGGPGGATIALREGIGPKRIAAGKLRGEFTFIDNTESPLDVMDLVFIDAPGTGYGRFFAEEAKKEYYGVDQDAEAFAQFIETWLKSHNRTASPRFVVGESYGGTRSGFVSENLLKRGLPLTSMILISPSTSAGGPNPLGNQDAAVLALPTQAAVAWSHKKGAYLNLPVEQASANAMTFALGDYAAALAKGKDLDPAEKARIAKQVSDYSGIPADQILKNDLKVVNFGETLLPGERLGRDDGRLNAPIEEMKKLPRPYDEPGSTLVIYPFDLIYAINSFFRYSFDYKPVSEYIRYSAEASQSWNANKVSRGPTSIPLMIKDQMAANPNLKVLMLAGYFDTTIPYLRAKLDFDAAKLGNRLESTLFKSGHAVFSDKDSSKLAGDKVRQFVKATVAGVK